MLCIVVFPLLMQDAVLILQRRERLRAREGRVDRKPRNINTEIMYGLHRFGEDVFVVIIHTKDKAALNHHVAPVERLHDLAVVMGAIEPLLDLSERRLSHRLEAKENVLTPAAGHGIQQLGIIGE